MKNVLKRLLGTGRIFTSPGPGGIRGALKAHNRILRGKDEEPKPQWRAYGDGGRRVRGTGFAALNNGQWVRA